MKWKISLETMNTGRWETVIEEVASTALEAEKAARRMAEEVIACDDERFDGPGTPLTTIIRITPEEN